MSARLASLVVRLALVAFVAALALWIELAPGIHAFETSDSVLVTLISLDKWTPYYWDQNRNGMLFALLAKPVASPFANFLVQSFLGAFAWIAAFFLAARWAVPRAWIAPGAVGAALWIGLESARSLHASLDPSLPFGASLALAFGALCLISGEKKHHTIRIALALALLAIASWVNVAVVVPLAPLLLTRALLERGETWRSTLASESAVGLALALVAFGCGMFFAHLAPVRQHYHFLAPGECPAAIAALARSFAERFLACPWTAALVALAALAGRSIQSRRESCKPVMKPVAAFLVSTIATFAIMGSVEHVKANESHARYALPVAILLGVALPIAALVPLLERASGRARRIATGASLGALAAAVVLVSGVPSPARVRAELDGSLGAFTESVNEGQATHVIGSYDRVWSIVFHARCVRYEQGNALPLWGITQRSGAVRELWDGSGLERARLAALAGDSSVEDWRRAYGLPELVEERRLGPVVILVPVAQRRR